MRPFEEECAALEQELFRLEGVLRDSWKEDWSEELLERQAQLEKDISEMRERLRLATDALRGAQKKFSETVGF